MTSNSTPAKVAVVTGASSGIGAATARALAADGYRVALLARRLDRITTLADELGNGSIAIEADVTDRDSIVAAADRVRQELGTADALINNAGVMLLGPFDSDQRADYRRMIEVNLLGAITTTEVFLDQLKDGGGDIINISSVAGRTARSGNGVYAATKWGINGWSESLRQELLPDVRVTLVEPGVVATELPNHITHADTRHGVQQLYDKAEVTAEDVAEIIAFILSRPRRLAINEILLRPADQGLEHRLGDRRPEHVVLRRLEVPEPAGEHRESTLDRRVHHHLLADRRRVGLGHYPSSSGASAASAYPASARCQYVSS